MLVRFNHNNIITHHTINVINDITHGESVNIDPNHHKTPHRIPNHTILHILNHTCGMTLSQNVLILLCLCHVLDTASTKPPTTAIHVENHAVSQINNTILNVGACCVVISNESEVKFCKKRYNTKQTTIVTKNIT